MSVLVLAKEQWHTVVGSLEKLDEVLTVCGLKVEARILTAPDYAGQMARESGLGRVPHCMACCEVCR